MESSSENSFTWTDTSRDSIESHSMAVAVDNGDASIKSDRHGKKKKLNKNVNNVNCHEQENEQHEVKPEVEENNDETKTSKAFKKKLVKQEPESDSDVTHNKIQQCEVNDDDNNQHNLTTASYDENFLNFKVKQEKISEKKKRKQSSVDDSIKSEKFKQRDSDSPGDSASNDREQKKSKTKKKKKKSKKRNDSECQEKMSIDDATDSGEPEHIQVNNTDSKASISKLGDASCTGNHSYQDDSSCGEISAIQGDNNHNLDTFIDSKTIEKENKNDNLYKNTILNQFKIGMTDDQNSPVIANKQKRTVRLSDRLRFEDESDLEVTHSTHTPETREDKISYKLKKFIKTNSNMTVVSQPLQHNSIITHDDDVWIVKCPKGIDVQAFRDTNLNIQGKSKLKIGGQTYDCSLEEEQCQKAAVLTIGSGRYKLDNFPLCGIINLRKRIPKAHFRDDNTMTNNQTNFIPLPETKCRHPLFGSNYKKAIKIPAAVTEKLNAHTESHQSTEAEEVTVQKRKKKKHKRDRSVQDCDETDAKHETILKSESEPLQVTEKKKKKKRKHAEDDGPAPKRIKKMKHDPESAEAWASEKAIEENLFNF